MNAPVYAPAPSSRNRTCHGFFSLGQVPATVYSSRHRDEQAVIVNVGAGSGMVATGRLTPAQARSAARALLQAAESVERAQRSPVFTRMEGGAAC